MPFYLGFAGLSWFELAVAILLVWIVACGLLTIFVICEEHKKNKKK